MVSLRRLGWKYKCHGQSPDFLLLSSNGFDANNGVNFRISRWTWLPVDKEAGADQRLISERNGTSTVDSVQVPRVWNWQYDKEWHGSEDITPPPFPFEDKDVSYFDSLREWDERSFAERWSWLIRAGDYVSSVDIVVDELGLRAGGRVFGSSDEILGTRAVFKVFWSVHVTSLSPLLFALACHSQLPDFWTWSSYFGDCVCASLPAPP